MKILKVHNVIHKRFKNQNILFKLCHKARIATCKHDMIEPTEVSEYSYYSNVHYAECMICEALLEIEGKE